jgi:hypothetical protein
MLLLLVSLDVVTYPSNLMTDSIINIIGAAAAIMSSSLSRVPSMIIGAIGGIGVGFGTGLALARLVTRRASTSIGDIGVTPPGVITRRATTASVVTSFPPISPISPHDTQDPGYLLDLGTMYQNSQVLIVATRLGLFAHLRQSGGDHALSIARALGLQHVAEMGFDGLRHIRDFLDTLVTLHVIERNGNQYK